MPELERRTGLSPGGIRCRIEDGIPLDAPFLSTRRSRVNWRGKRWRVRDIARSIGVHPRVIRERLASGVALDAPPGPGEEWHGRPLKRAPKSDAEENITDDALPFDQDKCAQLVRRYFANQMLVHTDEDIRAEFSDIAELSDAAVALIREWLHEEMFTARKGGDGEQLEMIGAVLGVSRERIRQDEMRALERARQYFVRTGEADDLVSELRERDSAGDTTYAAMADLMSAGTFEAETRRPKDRSNQHSLAKRMRRERQAKRKAAV